MKARRPALPMRKTATPRKRRRPTASVSMRISATWACFASTSRASRVWSKPIEPHAMKIGWGTASSPVLHGDRLYIVNDNEEKSYLLALDKQTGKEVWRVERDEKSNWSTPFVWKNDQRTEIVTAGSGKVRSYDLDGKLLWWFKGMSGITVATPYSDDGLLYVSSGFTMDKHRPLYAIRPGAADDISLAPGETSNSSIAWSKPTAAPYIPTTLVYDGRLYVLYDRGTMSAFNSQTGEPLFEQQRIPEGKHFTSSPWANNGRVFCLNEDGVTFVVRSGDKFELLADERLADDDMCLATPAMIGDRLLIRTLGARLLHPQTGTQLVLKLRFGEREVETEHGMRLLRHSRGNPETEYVEAYPTAPPLGSTQLPLEMVPDT